ETSALEEIWPAGQPPNWQMLSENYRLQFERMQRYVRWDGDRLAYVRRSQRYQAELLKHATELFRRRKYRPTGGAFAFMLNDPAPAVSWSVVDWKHRPKAAYEVLAAAMRPVIVCSEYPDESYAAGTKLSFPLFIVNDLARDLGPLEWDWDLYLDGASVARGSGETEVPADSVTRVGETRARLPGVGRATLVLRLSGEGVDESNTYEFDVTDGRGR
ncbi:MAG TPA: hypothetical protein VFI90_07980, partial [Rubrobacter sp.]|nr:hypothetical protein [Rubrobacter sp.]